jgi:cobalt-zinc-cadmium efflux system outer membrane protein
MRGHSVSIYCRGRGKLRRELVWGEAVVLRFCVGVFLSVLVCAAAAPFTAAQVLVPDDISIDRIDDVPLAPAPLGEEALPVPSPPQIQQPEAEGPPKPIPLPPVDVPAADTRLTLSEAEALAEAFHPALREAASRVRAAQGNWVQVGLRPNPEIGYSGEEINDGGTAGKQGGFVRKEFVTAGKLGLSRAVASRDVAAAEQRVETARLQILTTVRVFYFDVLAAQRSLELARQLSGIANESVHASELRLRAMDIPRVSLLQSQIERESTALLEQRAAQRHTAAWRRLAAVIGVTDTQPAEMDDAFARPLPELQWDSTRERVLAESPELAELRFEVDRARAALCRASAGRVPNITAMAGVQLDNTTNDTIANVEVSMPLPVFDRNQGAIAQASGELAAAQAALQEGELALEERLAVAMRDYATARQQAATYAERVLPVAKESLDITNAGYQEGELDYLAVLSVQQTYAQANLAYLQNLETAWKKWAEIEGLLVGTLNDRSVDESE